MWLNTNDNTVIKKAVAITVDGVTHPKTIFSKWSEVELNAIGIYTPTIDPIPNRRYYTYNEEIDYVNKLIKRVPIARPLADVQATMVTDLEEVANSKFNSTTSGYTAGEMASWNGLEAEAISHQATPLTSGTLYDEAMMGGVTVDELVAKVLTNSTMFKQIKSYISGTRKRKSLEINALVDITACIAYENFVYDYTVTQSDVDMDSTLVLGTVIQRIGNKVIDWTI